MSVSWRRLLQKRHSRGRPAAGTAPPRYNVRLKNNEVQIEAAPDRSRPRFMKRLVKLWRWFDDRLGISDLVGPSMMHLVPRDAGWWYVFGSATTLAFIVQVVTGVALSFFLCRLLVAGLRHAALHH